MMGRQSKSEKEVLDAGFTKSASIRNYRIWQYAVGKISKAQTQSKSLGQTFFPNDTCHG